MSSGIRDSGSARPRLQAESFKRYLRTIVEHMWLVALCVAIAVGAAAVYVETATKQYTAQSQMLVTPAPVDNSALIGLPILHTSGDPTRDVLTAASLITTQQVAGAVIRSLHLNQSPLTLLGKVQAVPIGQSDLVGVQVQSSSPAQAQAIANEFAKQVVATRTAALHAAVAALIPGLQAQVAALPPAQRSGPGTLGDQLAQLRQLQSSGDPTTTISALAPRPTSPTSPKTKLTLAAALFGGLIVGIGAAFGFDALDPRLRREEQLRDLFGLPVLARIPRERRRKRGRPILPDEVSFGAAEGYRTLRTLLASRAAGDPRAFLVTGSSPAEGKTTSAINLTAALAHGGSRVILLEADLRRPKIAATLGLTCTWGIENVLADEVDVEQALTPAEFDNASAEVIAVNHPGVHHANLLSFQAARRLINEALELADFVVIDSPPLTAVVDALPLAQLVDEVLVVARLGTSRVGKLTELHDLLLEEGSYPTGIVLIGDSAERRYYYYGDDVMPAELGITQLEREPRPGRSARE
jgi:polysaccharide biosynthesis transport protein